MAVLICLIFSVLSTIDQYVDFANETLFWMVSAALSRGLRRLHLVCSSIRLSVAYEFLLKQEKSWKFNDGVKGKGKGRILI